MRKLIPAFTTLLICCTAHAQKTDYATLVNPFIGTGGHGHTFPGATVPFGAVQLSPDTRMADWDGSSGYHYSDSLIYGFSHTHLSGTGIPDYCDVPLMPFTGEVQWNKEAYRASFAHKNESAKPGYYSVRMNNGIGAQLTASTHAGMHLYNFPAGAKNGSVLIDLSHRDFTIDANIEKLDDYTLRGRRRSKSWAQDQHTYFYLVFSQPIGKFLIRGVDDLQQGHVVKCAVSFRLPQDGRLMVKCGISGVDEEGAKKNVQAEMPDWNFTGIRRKATVAWNAELGQIEVEGGTADERTIFYTALYHCAIQPNIFQDVDGRFRGTDNKVHSHEGFTNYTVFSLWDTYRAYHPLQSIINQTRTNDWINTFLAQYRYGGMLPVWELAGNETFCMIGYHSVPVILEAYQKGIRGYDDKLALKAMRSYAESNRYGLKDYRRLGYLPNNLEHESVSKTLEYAYDDWCIGRFAEMTGDKQTAATYLQRAQNYRNVYDPSTGHMRGKLDAIWQTPFAANEVNNFFTEGNSWQYTFAVQQDIPGLIGLMGGMRKFGLKLDSLFGTSSQMGGREQPDVTGLIGQYAHGNEPSHHMAYLYHYAGQPYKTQSIVRRICREFYKNAPDGLIGNEDCGQMSAWYVFSAMGFYPVTPGSGEYVVGTPVFNKTTIHLENGKDFVLEARRRNAGDYHVNAMTKAGQPVSVGFGLLLQSDIVNGGKVALQIGEAIVPKKGDEPEIYLENVPPPQTTVAVPFVRNTDYRFKKNMKLELGHVDAGATLMWKREDETAFHAYKRPVPVSASGGYSFYAEKDGMRSPVVSQRLHRIPADKDIKVVSTPVTMYTAGGTLALIDGVIGDGDWRAGGWQSYFNSDFEAIVDLRSVKPVLYVGIHVLQDVSPWIVYPRSVSFESSTDGVHYRPLRTVDNKLPPEEKGLQTQTLGSKVNATARYIRVRAKSGGALPAWHESAGQPSHLFIDEVVVR